MQHTTVINNHTALFLPEEQLAEQFLRPHVFIAVMIAVYPVLVFSGAVCVEQFCVEVILGTKFSL